MMTLYQSAMDARSKGDLSTAQELLHRSLVEDASDEVARRALGVVCFELNDFAETLKVLYPLLRTDTSDAELLTYYGISLKRVGRYNEAISVLEHANNIHSSSKIQSELVDAQRLAAMSTQDTSGSPPRQERGERLLAEDLDKTSPNIPSDKMRGALQFRWHRQPTSYWRLWLGIIFALGGIILLSAQVPHRIGYSSTFINVPNVDHYVSLALVLLTIAGILMAVAAVISALFTHYTVYEHRIDIRRGVMWQKLTPIWLYDITAVDMRRTLLLTLTHTASLEISYDAKESSQAHERIVAASSVEKMQHYLEKLQGDFLMERRAMKKIWI